MFARKDIFAKPSMMQPCKARDGEAARAYEVRPSAFIIPQNFNNLKVPVPALPELRLFKRKKTLKRIFDLSLLYHIVSTTKKLFGAGFAGRLYSYTARTISKQISDLLIVTPLDNFIIPHILPIEKARKQYLRAFECSLLIQCPVPALHPLL